MTTVDLLGVPLDLGASRRGVDMGPYAVRAAGLRDALLALGHDVRDHGNLPVADRGTFAPDARGIDFLPTIAAVCAELATRVEASVRDRHFPVVLGGDHSLAAGSVAGASRAMHARNERLGLLWIDAHGDINTPDTTPSGNVHGMPVAHLLGYGDPRLHFASGAAVAGAQTVLVGIRDLDPGERAHLRAYGAHVFTMHDVDRRGLSNVMEEAIALASADTKGLWVSYDADVQDPVHAPGVGTPVAGGLSWREGHLVMEMIADSGHLVGLDLVE
ncbi:MAG: arginase, partial [Gemmatimonadaceae bacterium]|nr:arginase [Gemmatimonadaceae bacterium]